MSGREIEMNSIHSSCSAKRGMINDDLNGHLSRNYTKQSVLLIDIIVRAHVTIEYRLREVVIARKHFSSEPSRAKPSQATNLQRDIVVRLPDFVCVCVSVL